MNQRIISITLLACLVFAGCDSNSLESDLLEPAIQIQLIDLREGVSDSNKGNLDRSAVKEVWNVKLDVTNLESNQVFSPPSVSADNSQSSEVRFNLALPPDSLYEFKVTFSQGGQSSGRGLVHHFISESTSSVTVPAYIFDATTPALVFEPSLISRPVNSDISARNESNVINMVYLGVDKPAEGLAAVLDVTGIAEDDLAVEGPTLFAETGRLNLLWNWATSPAGSSGRSAGSLTFSNASTNSFCVEVEAGDARAVHADASISKQSVKSEACVEIGN